MGELIIKYEGLEDILSIQKNMNQSTPTANKEENVDLFSVDNFKQYLLRDADRIRLNSLIAMIESGDDYIMMKELLKPLYSLSESVHKYSFDIVFAPIKHLLKNMSKSSVSFKSITI